MNLTSKTFSALISTFVSRPQPSQPNEKGWRVAACGALIALASLAFASSAVAGEAPHRPVSLPLTFEENRGQADASWKYVLHRDGLEAVFYRNGFGFILPGSKGNAGNVRVRLVGGDAAPDGKNLLQGRSNYLIGADSSRWVRGIPNYHDVEYQHLYPGISVDFYGNGRELEHDFQVEAGADPSRIAFRIEGAEHVNLNGGGSLEIHFGGSTLTMRKPVAYQNLAGGRKEVSVGFRQGGDGTVRFNVGDYASDVPLVIDPVFVFSTYLDGSGPGQITGVTTDSAGNVYVTGETTSAGFPTLGAEQSQLGSTKNAFVTKLDPTGAKLIYSTYLGGASTSSGSAIAVDAGGDAIVAGVANSYFLASLSPDGSQLNYFLDIDGGVANLGSNGELALDSSGNAYLAGDTGSPGFQVTAGTLPPSIPVSNYSTMFALKVDRTGKLVYATVITGNATDTSAFMIPYGIAVDAQGQLTIAGAAGPVLPTTSGVAQAAFPNTVDFTSTAGFVLQLNSTASAINFASYLPGTDTVAGMAVSAQGNLYFVGATSETNLPVTANAYQRTADSGYVMELSPGATSVQAATYFKGFTMGTPYSISDPMRLALDSSGNVAVAGMTLSSAFPMLNPFTPVFEPVAFRATDMAVAEFSPNLGSLLFGSFVSSTDAYYPGSTFGSMTVDKKDHLIVAGTTEAFDFPTTAGAYQPLLSATVDPATFLTDFTYASFIASLDLATPSGSACLDAYNASNELQADTVLVTNCGNAPMHVSSVSSSDPSFVPSESCGAIAVGSSCQIPVSVNPLHSGEITGVVTINTDASVAQQKVVFTGNGSAPNLVPVASPFSFGHQVVGTSVTATMTIQNSGTIAVAIASITVNGSSFSVSSYQCNGMAFGGNCTFQVVFTPQATGTLTGSLVIASNDPVNPHFVVNLTGVGDSAYLTPAIDTLSPALALINTGPVAIKVAGRNFYPTSVVQVNGSAQATTYVSNTELDFTLAAPTGTGQIPVTVAAPSPGGTSAPVSFTPYQIVPMTATSLVSVATSGVLYASIPSSSSLNPNTVIPVAPSSGALGTPIPVGNNPVMLAASSDGQYLFVALAADQTVQRINLNTQAVDRTFPYAANVAATDLQAVPGSPQEVVLAQGGNLSLYNDSGLVNSVAASTFSSVTFAGNPLTIYGMGTNTFTAVSLTNSGLQLPGVTFGKGFTGSTVVSDGVLLYTNIGQVWSPQSETQSGAFSLNTGWDMSSYANFHNMTMDTSVGKIFAVEIYTDDDGDSSAALAGFNTQQLQPTGELDFPTLGYGQIENLVRWGSDGFAFVSNFQGLERPGIYLARTSVVGSPVTNPVPGLSSLYPSSAAVGTINIAVPLTVNGWNFTPSSVIYWNGSALATNFVSATQVTARFSDSMFASLGTAQVTVVNQGPGGGTSNALAFAIVTNDPVTSLSSTALDFGNVKVGNSSSAQYVSFANYGPEYLSISSISTTGDFSTQSTCTSNLTYLTYNAACQLAIVFKPTATGLRTGSISISDNAIDSPQVIKLSGTGLAAPLATASVTVTTSAATITDQQTVNVSVSVAGGTGQATPTGTIDLSGGVYSAQQSLASGLATFGIPAGSLSSGTNTLTASYSGDATYGAANGTAAVTVSQIAVAIAAASPVSAGNSTTATVTVAAGSSYTGTANLTCTLVSSPANAQSLPTCSLKSTSVALQPEGLGTAVLTVSTTAASTAALVRPPFWNLWGLGGGGTALAVLLMLGVPVRRRRWLAMLTLPLVVVAFGVVGCGGNGSQSTGSSGGSGVPATTAGVYTFKVTATDGSNTQITATANVAITVQ
jgi:hypothetical protein